MTPFVEAESKVITPRRAWLLVGFMGVALFLDNSDRHAIFSLFPVLKSELHFTDAELGLTGSIFLWVYALCSPIAGQIGDWYSKRVLVVLSLLLWSGVTTLTGLSNSVWMLLTFRGLLGITESLFVPAAIALLVDFHGPRTRSLAVTLFGIGEYAGVVMGGWYGSLIAQNLHWRLVFLSLGLFGIAYTIPYMAFLKGVGEGVAAETRKSRSSPSIAVLAKVPTYWSLCATFPLCVCVLWLLYTWLPTFLYEKFSLSLAEAGFTATVYLQSATLVGSLAGAALADWLYSRTRASRLWLSSIGFFLAAPGLYFIGNSDSLFFTKVAALVFGLCGGLFLANLVVAAFDVIPPGARASASGWLNLIGSSVAGFASLLEGTWKQAFGIQNMMTYAALACILAGLLLLLSTQFYFREDYERAHGHAGEAGG